MSLFRELQVVCVVRTWEDSILQALQNHWKGLNQSDIKVRSVFLGKSLQDNVQNEQEARR